MLPTTVLLAISLAQSPVGPVAPSVPRPVTPARLTASALAGLDPKVLRFILLALDASKRSGEETTVAIRSLAAEIDSGGRGLVGPVSPSSPPIPSSAVAPPTSRAVADRVNRADAVTRRAIADFVAQFKRSPSAPTNAIRLLSQEGNPSLREALEPFAEN